MVSISSPASDSTIAGTIEIAGSASDNTGVDRVELIIDGAQTLSASGTNTWTAQFESAGYTDGSHTIVATAVDQAGNAGTTSVTVEVANGSDPSPVPSPEPTAQPTPIDQQPVPAPQLPIGSIGGWVFKEIDRDGIYETDETPLTSQRLYLYDGSGTYLGNTSSGADGWYRFDGLIDGTYRIEFAPAPWWALRNEWVPDTTGSIFPRVQMTLSGRGRADFGWRPIVRSIDASKPISSFTATNGLKIESYNDVVLAETLYEHLMSGSLIGAEAAHTRIRFDLGGGGSTSTMAVQSNGVYTEFHATSYVPYLSWLDTGDRILFHEYGHAWSMYHAFIVQQDPSLNSYLEARGLADDGRVGSSYAWDPKEIIAEDYRQLFGTATARAGGQINTEIPDPGDVPGLEQHLSGAFRQARA